MPEFPELLDGDFQLLKTKMPAMTTPMAMMEKKLVQATMVRFEFRWRDL
ncbi:MAG: hypothetical protein NWQ16_08595 [Akkermansiaceae bacterium]|nr:hypothetical protein [Akkermansiaceae bacterium]